MQIDFSAVYIKDKKYKALNNIGMDTKYSAKNISQRQSAEPMQVTLETTMFCGHGNWKDFLPTRNFAGPYWKGIR